MRSEEEKAFIERIGAWYSEHAEEEGDPEPMNKWFAEAKAEWEKDAPESLEDSFNSITALTLSKTQTSEQYFAVRDTLVSAYESLKTERGKEIAE